MLVAGRGPMPGLGSCFRHEPHPISRAAPGLLRGSGSQAGFLGMNLTRVPDLLGSR